jgi:RNA polymerase-binding transcription factor DksA
VDHDAARQNLKAEHLRLESVRSSVENDRLHDESEDESSSELSHMVLQHPADIASDAFEREKDFSILEQVEAELADVERALARLDHGTYGTCERCGKEARRQLTPPTVVFKGPGFNATYYGKKKSSTSTDSKPEEKEKLLSLITPTADYAAGHLPDIDVRDATQDRACPHLGSTVPHLATGHFPKSALPCGS